MRLRIEGDKRTDEKRLSTPVSQTTPLNRLFLLWNEHSLRMAEATSLRGQVNFSRQDILYILCIQKQSDVAEAECQQIGISRS
jgi:hypothetical protein